MIIPFFFGKAGMNFTNHDSQAVVFVLICASIKPSGLIVQFL